VAVGYSRDREGAERVAAEVGAAGGQAIAVQGDLARMADVEAMVAKAVAAFGPIDILVNNAAVFDFKPCRTSTRRTSTASTTPMCLGC
jgi:3-oxoacyl-[acyl-carrier protein] reductase